MPRHELWLTDSSGKRLSQLGNKKGKGRGRMLLDNAVMLDCTKTVNRLGAMHLVLPESFDRRLLARDNMIQFWRAPTGGRLAMFHVYLINRWIFSTIGGRRIVDVWGQGPNSIIDFRSIAYFNNTTQTTIEAKEADDAMKDIVRQNLVTVTAFETGADTTERQLSNVSVADDLALGPQIDGQYAWENAINVLQEMSADSQSKANQVWFEMVPILGTDSISFQFRTSTGQPRQDLTGIGVAFSVDKGTLKNSSLEYDYTNEITFVYALGQGEDSDRTIKTASDATRIGQSAYGRREASVPSSFTETDDGVQSKADAALFAGRPRIKFQGDPVDTRTFRFGRDWRVGDKLVSRDGNDQFETIVTTARIRIEGGRETVTTKLRYEN